MIRWTIIGITLLAAGIPIVAEEKPQKPAVRARADDDPLPSGALARLGTVRLRHAGHVQAMAVSADGTMLASCAADESIRVWDTSTGKEVRRLTLKNAAATVQPSALAFTRDGKTLVSGDSAGTVHVWDITDGRELRRFGHRKNKITCLTMAPDDRTVWSSGTDQTMHEWLLATGLEMRQVKGHQGATHHLAVTPDGKHLVSVGSEKESKGGFPRIPEYRARVWDLAQSREVRTMPLPMASTFERCLALSHDGKLLALMGQDAVLRVYDVTTDKLVRQVNDTNRLTSLAFSPDGKLLAGVGSQSGVDVWGVTSGLRLRSLQSKQGTTHVPILFGPNGKFLAWASENTIQLWDPSADRAIAPDSGHRAPVLSLSYSPDGKRVYSAANDRTFRLWDVARKKPLAKYEVRPGGSLHIAAGGDDDSLFLGNPLHVARIRALDPSAKELRRFEGWKQPLYSLSVSPDGKFLAIAAADPFVWLFDAESGKAIAKLVETRKPQDVKGKGKLPPPVTGTSRPNHVHFSPDGTCLAVSGFNYPLQIWDVKSAKLVCQVATTRSSQPKLAFSANGRSLALLDFDLRIIEAVTGQDRLVLPGLNARSVAFSADGSVVLVGGQKGKLQAIEVIGGRELDNFAGHSGDITSIAVSPDGNTFVSGSADTSIILWDAKALRGKGLPTPARLEAAEIALLWKFLADTDGLKGHQAVWSFVAASEQSLPYMKERLRPAAAMPAAQIGQLIADLDSDSFQTRQKAALSLENLGEVAEADLIKTLEQKPSLETGRRITAILAKLKGPSSEKIQTLRAVEVLEYVANTEARQLLTSLSRGASGHWLTEAASHALQRLKRRAG